MKRGNDMRNTFGVIIVLLTCLLILPCPKDVNGADWKLYGKLNGLEFFYDVQSIHYLLNNSIQVFVETIPGDEESRVKDLATLRKVNPKIPDNWLCTIRLCEINCKDRSYKILEIREYNAKNKIVDRKFIENKSSGYISAESAIEALYGIVCVEKDSKKKGW
jgi:hypothetical protein